MTDAPATSQRSSVPADPVAAVNAVLDQAINGRAMIVTVTGERGSGKTRLVDRAVRTAQGRQMQVVSLRGAASPAPFAYQGVQDLVRPVIGDLRLLVPHHEAVLRQVASGRLVDVDEGSVRVAVLDLMAAMASATATCLVIDDLDLFDDESAAVLLYAFHRLDTQRIAVVVSGRRRFDGLRSVGIVLDPLPDEHVTEVLARRGVAVGPARACARAARGLPGMAIALADGLTRAQRSGHERLPAMIRPARSLVHHQQAVLESLPDRLQRALVVVAADELGQVGAVRRALAILGEDDGALEDAEAAGLIELDGLAVRFTDPWWRPAAYYLVAPASRRAAHRALAESYAAPEQAVARAWQLAAAAVGPSDRVAEALGLVAADVARRGSTAAAVDTFRTAVEFGETAHVRGQLLLAALGVAMDGLDMAAVADLVARMEPTSPDAIVAVAEAQDLAGISGRSLSEREAAGDGPWAARRRARLALLRSARGGTVTSDLQHDLSLVHPAQALLVAAQQQRHAGRLAAARDALSSLDRLLDASCTELVAATQVLHADLDQLAGRTESAVARLAGIDRPLDPWTRHAADWVRLRVTAAIDQSSRQPWTARVGVDVATDQLAAVRAGIARGCRARDAEHLMHVARHADSLGLVVEAAETDLARLEVLAAGGRAIDTSALESLGTRLWTMGVHGWDARLASLEHLVERSAEADLSRLSQAERRVAEAVGAGMTNREAAASLFLSVKTVDFHLQQIYRKLAVRSRTELAVLIVGDDRRNRRFAS